MRCAICGADLGVWDYEGLEQHLHCDLCAATLRIVLDLRAEAESADETAELVKA